MENMSLVYYPKGPQVLKDVSLTIEPRQRIGIVGRTGAGKSSLVAALFRMPEPAGRIIIDGIDIQTLNIHSSRRALSVIPQDPILFTGTLRMNLDPFEESDDCDIWKALEEAGLKAKVRRSCPNNSDMKSWNAERISVLENDSCCLGRSLLQKSRIIVLDEATANVDYKTDRLIQEQVPGVHRDYDSASIEHHHGLRQSCGDGKRAGGGVWRTTSFVEEEGGMFSELYRCHEVHI